MKTNRRSFLRLSAFALPFTRVNQLFAKTPVAGSPVAGSPVAGKPLVISTWDSGLISNAAAWPVLKKGGRALDAVEQAAIAIENDINCCVGLGGNPDRDGRVTLDACIMDEKSNCGAVAFLERIKHPVSVARKLMETTPHAADEYKKWLKKAEYKPVINIEHKQSKGHGPFAPARLDDGSFNHDTMGTLALDALGNLSGMCTTSGMGFKMRGRVGDSPIIGAGLFVDNEIGAATSSGQGEEVIRIAGTHLVVEFMRNGSSPEEACQKAVERIVNRDPERAKTFQVGFLAVNKRGEVGAYSVQSGFAYTITSGDGKGKVVASKSHFA
jgi:N4-(beta-N-acetylglucosaminyl)-L-asparaginase